MNKNNIATKLALLTAMSSISINSPEYIGFGTNRYAAKQKDIKPCLNCGNPKQHNNCFCSADCCREYRAEVKHD